MKVNQIKIGVVLSYLSLALSTVVSLIYTPIMLTRLGESEYGVYNLVLPIISYLNLLNFGLSSAYVRFYSRYRTEKDSKKIAKLNGMFLITYTVLGCILLVIGLTLASYGNIIFGNKLTSDEVLLGERLLRIMTVTAAISMPLSVFDSNVMVNEQYLFQKVLAMVKSILNPLIIIPLLIIGFRSTAIVVVTLVVTILIGAVNVIYCIRKLNMRFSFRHYDFALMREICGFSVYVFISIIVDDLNWSIDRLLLGWLHGTHDVTIYVVGSQLNVYYLTMTKAISNVMTPRVHRMVASNCSNKALDEIFTRVGRLQFILMTCIYLGFIAVGRTFTILWAGGSQYEVSFFIALILFTATILPGVQTLGIEIQKAKNMHKFRSLVYLAVAIFNAVLTIPLCYFWHGFGAAIATLISTLLGNLLLMNWYYHRKMGLDTPVFWRSIMSFLPSLAVPAAAAICFNLFAPIHSYIDVIIWGVLFVMIFGAFVSKFGMNDYERGLIKDVLNKFGRFPLVKKLASIRRQFRHMSFKRMTAYINQVHVETRIPRIMIFADMVWCELYYGIGYLDYTMFGLAKKHGKIRKTYLTGALNQELTLKLNDPKYYPLMNDKRLFDVHFKKYLNRDFLILTDSTEEDLKKFCTCKKAVFAKVINTCGGAGIQKFTITKDMDYHEFYQQLLSNDQVLLEDAIVQHHEMNRLNPDSVNTLRVVTLDTKNGIKTAYVILRIGRKGSCVDNIGSGGMYLHINRDGTLKSPACDKANACYTRHPETGTEFEGFKIPYFDEAVKMALEMAEDVKEHFGYVGWDICISESGPCAVEGNILPGYDVCQNAKHTKCGMVPRFEKMLGYKIAK